MREISGLDITRIVQETGVGWVNILPTSQTLLRDILSIMAALEPLFMASGRTGTVMN